MNEQDEAPTERPTGEATPSATTRSTKQWAELRYPKNARGQEPFERWKHAAADAMHGWSLHEYHENEPMQLSAADYAAAIAAVVENSRPHAAALSKHKRVRDAPTPPTQPQPKKKERR